MSEQRKFQSRMEEIKFRADNEVYTNFGAFDGDETVRDVRFLFDHIAQLRQTIEFCRDKAAETPEISKTNRVGKALSDIRDECVTVLSGRKNS